MRALLTAVANLRGVFVRVSRALVVPVALVSVLSTGCGGALYAMSVNSAASRLEEARSQGAEQLAPYEYYYAREHLHQAEVEANDASYSDAVQYAETAEEFATKAIELSRAARRASGRR